MEIEITKKEWAKPEFVDLEADETENNYGYGHDGLNDDTYAFGS